MGKVRYAWYELAHHGTPLPWREIKQTKNQLCNNHLIHFQRN